MPDTKIISIHALREEGDEVDGLCLACCYVISIHALREEGDCQPAPLALVWVTFLSTPSARRATVRSVLSQSSRMDFYPRPPRGGRR